MRHALPATTRSRLVPLAALLLATALGGCVGYSSYPSRDYSYSYPSGYYAGYPRTYSSSNSYRPYYSPDYGRYNNTYETGGAADNNSDDRCTPRVVRKWGFLWSQPSVVTDDPCDSIAIAAAWRPAGSTRVVAGARNHLDLLPAS